jgi:hypothetical protein
MDDSEKHVDEEQAGLHKDAGNRLYSDGDYESARTHYLSALDLLSDISPTAAACHSNLAACALCTESYDQVNSICLL